MRGEKNSHKFPKVVLWSTFSWHFKKGLSSSR